MLNIFTVIYEWLLRIFWFVSHLEGVQFRAECMVSNGCFRATEMNISVIGLQNAGKTSLIRVLAVRVAMTLTSALY